jgi:hypothetical protein
MPRTSNLAFSSLRHDQIWPRGFCSVLQKLTSCFMTIDCICGVRENEIASSPAIFRTLTCSGPFKAAWIRRLQHVLKFLEIPASTCTSYDIDVHMSMRTYMYIYIYYDVCLFICIIWTRSIDPSIHPSTHPSIHPSIHSIYLYKYKYK